MKQQSCINCGHQLVQHNSTWICPECNEDREIFNQPFFENDDSNEYTYIECPGATLYKEGTREIEAGVKFSDQHPLEYEIIKNPVFAPNHTRRRKIRTEALGSIRRCQACQDYTVRLVRREGKDFYIPSKKHPKRKKLRSVQHRTIA